MHNSAFLSAAISSDSADLAALIAGAASSMDASMVVGTLVEPNGAPKCAENTIFIDAARPSHILLPVIRRDG